MIFSIDAAVGKYFSRNFIVPFCLRYFLVSIINEGDISSKAKSDSKSLASSSLSSSLSSSSSSSSSSSDDDATKELSLLFVIIVTPLIIISDVLLPIGVLDDSLVNPSESYSSSMLSSI